MTMIKASSVAPHAVLTAKPPGTAGQHGGAPAGAVRPDGRPTEEADTGPLTRGGERAADRVRAGRPGPQPQEPTTVLDIMERIFTAV